MRKLSAADAQRRLNATPVMAVAVEGTVIRGGSDMAVFLILFIVTFGGVVLMFAMALIEHIWTMPPDEMRRLYDRGNRKPLRLKRKTYNF